MLGWFPGHHAVLTMQLGSESPASQPPVLLILAPPGRVFTSPVKPCTEPNVANHVMHRSKSVVGPRRVAPKNGMTPTRVITSCGDLK